MNADYIIDSFVSDVSVVEMMTSIVEAKRQMAYRTSAALQPVARPSELCPVGVLRIDGTSIGGAVVAAAFH